MNLSKPRNSFVDERIFDEQRRNLCERESFTSKLDSALKVPIKRTEEAKEASMNQGPRRHDSCIWYNVGPIDVRPLAIVGLEQASRRRNDAIYRGGDSR